MKNKDLKEYGQLLLVACLLAVVGLAGCGDSFNDEISSGNNGNNINTSNVRVSFSRANVLAQGTQSAFSTADQYGVSIVDSNNQAVIPTTFVSADTTTDLQVIQVTGIPNGTYRVVISAFLNGVLQDQVASGTTALAPGAVVEVGVGSTIDLAVFTGSFTPTNPPTTTTTTGTGTTTGGSTTGGYTTGGYTGGPYQ